jgi:hypothetical protein
VCDNTMSDCIELWLFGKVVDRAKMTARNTILIENGAEYKSIMDWYKAVWNVQKKTIIYIES